MDIMDSYVCGCFDSVCGNSCKKPASRARSHSDTPQAHQQHNSPRARTKWCEETRTKMLTKCHIFLTRTQDSPPGTSQISFHSRHKPQKITNATRESRIPARARSTTNEQDAGHQKHDYQTILYDSKNHVICWGTWKIWIHNRTSWYSGQLEDQTIFIMHSITDLLT